MSSSVLLEAFKGTNKTVPVWFMRQAGRYLPEYQAIREKYTLKEMFQTPQLAAKITLLPINILGVDAAILFADILTLPAQMGFNITFDNTKGPVIDTDIDLNKIHDFENLDYIKETIQLVNEELPEDIPLIGFAGSPFTVLTYLLEGGSGTTFHKTMKFIAQEPEAFHQLMDWLTLNTINYLKLQKESGVKVFQVFDTWAGILRPTDYAHLVLPYIQKIFNAVDLPSIYYIKNCSHLLPLMNQSRAEFLSVCHTVVLGHQKTVEKTKKGIQGNLYNGLLYADEEILKKEVHDVLIGAQNHNRYIFNLSHGVFPTVEADKLKRIVDQVHSFPWNK